MSAAQSAKWRAENLEQRRAIDRRYYANNQKHVRDRRLQMFYGITLAQFNEILANQGGICAICKTPEPGDRWNSWCVDHCHTTGVVRGVLCSKCNKGLGFFKDSPERLAAAIEYLNKQHEVSP